MKENVPAITNFTECNESPGNDSLITMKFPFHCLTSVSISSMLPILLFTIVSLVLKVCKLSNADENVVLILARCLPHIVPNVLLNKREVRACVENGRATKAYKPTLQCRKVLWIMVKLKVFQRDKWKQHKQVYLCFLLGPSCETP